ACSPYASSLLGSLGGPSSTLFLTPWSIPATGVQTPFGPPATGSGPGIVSVNWDSSLLSLADKVIVNTAMGDLLGALQGGFAFELPNFCLSDFSVQLEPGNTDPQRAKTPIPPAFLNISGTELDAGDPPGPEEWVGMTYEMAPGQLTETIETGLPQSFGGPARPPRLSPVDVPLVPVLLQAALVVDGGPLDAADGGSDVVASDVYLMSETPEQILFPYPYGSFHSSPSGFDTSLQFTAVPFAVDAGPQQVTTCVAVIDWHAPLTDAEADAGYPFASQPTVVDDAGVSGIVTPTSTIALSSGTAGCPAVAVAGDAQSCCGVSCFIPPASGDPPGLANFIDPDVVQAFSGETLVQLFEPTPAECLHRRHPHGRRDRGDDGTAGDDGSTEPPEPPGLDHAPGVEDGMRCAKDADDGQDFPTRDQGDDPSSPAPTEDAQTTSAPVDPPASDPTSATLGPTFVLTSQSSGETLAFQPAGGVWNPSNFVHLLCSTQPATTRPVGATFQDFERCNTRCLNPPGPGECCYSSRTLVPPQVGMKLVDYDLRQASAPGSYVASVTYPFMPGSEPNDRDAGPDGYLEGPVPYNGTITLRPPAAASFPNLPPDPVELIGATIVQGLPEATPVSVYGQGAGGGAPGAPVTDLACFIGTDPGHGFPVLSPSSETGPLGQFYLPQPQDQIVVSIGLPGPDGNIQFLDAGLVPFQAVQAITGVGLNECSYVSAAYEQGFLTDDEGQPAYQVEFATDAGMPILLSFHLAGAGSACWPPGMQPLLRIDGVGLSGGVFAPTGELIGPGKILADLQATSSAEDAVLGTLGPGGDWPATCDTLADSGCLFFEGNPAPVFSTSVDDIVDNGVLLDPNGSPDPSANCSRYGP
ncbi:MAG: hypothetical protein ACYDCL_18480, partial [Myxococcales bacterium]